MICRLHEPSEKVTSRSFQVDRERLVIGVVVEEGQGMPGIEDDRQRARGVDHESRDRDVEDLMDPVTVAGLRVAFRVEKLARRSAKLPTRLDGDRPLAAQVEGDLVFVDQDPVHRQANVIIQG